MSTDTAYFRYVMDVVEARGWTPETRISYTKQPFNFLTFELFQATQNPAWLPIFIEETYKWREESPRTSEGIVTHPRGAARGGGQAVLIDFMQCYVSHMAAVGEQTGDTTLFDECVEQIRMHRTLLQNVQSGLWSQGRGWLANGDVRLSPGAWSRGDGWLIRGLEKSLRHLPRDTNWSRATIIFLREVADTLLKVQRPNGVWHTLLHRAPEESPVDTSGTAMIAFHLARAYKAGHLPETRYLEAAQRAFIALPPFVGPDGVVESASPGPGPLETEAPWLVPEFPPDDPHGTFAFLFAAAH